MVLSSLSQNVPVPAPEGLTHQGLEKCLPVLKKGTILLSVCDVWRHSLCWAWGGTQNFTNCLHTFMIHDWAVITKYFIWNNKWNSKETFMRFSSMVSQHWFRLWNAAVQPVTWTKIDQDLLWYLLSWIRNYLIWNKLAHAWNFSDGLPTALTHWPLGDLTEILEELFSSLCKWLMAEVSLVKLPSNSCHWTLQMTSQD